MSDGKETGLVQFQELPAIAANAPAILEKNTKRLQHVKNKGQELLDIIEAEDITPEIDQACNEYLIGVATLKKMANELRSPLTQMLTAVSKEFTSIENDMDVKTPGTIPYKIQEHRNELARQEEIKRRKALEEEKSKRQAAEEAIDIKARVELKVREKYNTNLIAAKQKYIDLFNTFETVDQEAAIKVEIDKMPLSYPRDKFELIPVPITAIYVKAEDLAALIYSTKMAMYDELNANFKENMEAHKHHLIDQIPARKQEILEIAKAGAAEKKRLEQAALLRQKEEQVKLEREESDRQAQAIKDAETTKQVGEAQLSFETDVATAAINSETTQAVKHSYVIEVKTMTGWMLVANLWFKEIGPKVSMDKMPQKKWESMKKDLEVLAFNGGPRLDDSAHIEYFNDVKAVTKKTTPSLN